MNEKRRVHLGTTSERLSPPLRWHLRTRMSATSERLALRAVLTAARLLGLAAGVHLRQWRGGKDPLGEAHSLVQEAQLQARMAWEIVDMLLVRFSKIRPTTLLRSGSGRSRSRISLAGPARSRPGSFSSARTRSRSGNARPTRWPAQWDRRSSPSHRYVASPTPCARRCS